MKLSHVAFWTNDATRLKAFYVKYFDARDLAADAGDGSSSGFLDTGGGARLEIMQAHPPLSADRQSEAGIGLTHIAFGAESRSEVDRMSDRFSTDGVRFEKPTVETEDGFYEFAVFDPDGNIVEITCKLAE